MIDLTLAPMRKALADKIGHAVDAFCVKHFDEGHRNHLGASIIGHECLAYGWNTFRWLKREKFSGRMLRLFNRGHKEEPRFLDWLRGAGCSVWDTDPATGKQFRIKAILGHFGGSLDAIVRLPDDWQVPEPILGEFKTHKNSRFVALVKNGVAVAEPKHVKQMNTYGPYYGLRFALYCAVNKDTDELYFEIVELKPAIFDEMHRKANEIILASMQPPKIAEVITYVTCKTCHFAGICHRGDAPEINCRSCRFAQPVEGGEWYCHAHTAVIPADVIPRACASYARII